MATPSIAADVPQQIRFCRSPSNDQIAARLTVSVRTVERHLSNAYLKLGISGKAARTGAVARLLRSPR